MRYKMICSDVDGTLLDDAHCVTEKTRRSILRAVGQGMMFAIASARSPAGIEPIVKKNGFCCCIIAFNGALILDEKRSILYENGMSVAEAWRITEALEQIGTDVTWNVYTKDRWIVKNRRNPRVQREERIVETIAEEGNVKALSQETVIDKILCMVSREHMAETERWMRKNFPEYVIVRSSACLLEIMKAGNNKAQGLRNLCANKKINEQEVIAFGDHYNDLEMLTVAGCGVLMKNAPQEIKKSWLKKPSANVRMLTEDHNHDGIARVLEKVIDVDEKCDYNWCMKNSRR